MPDIDGMPIMSIEEMLPIPWGIIDPHEEQARKNHGGQTLKRLAERGGLLPSEAVAILEDRPWKEMDETMAIKRLAELIAAAFIATLKIRVRLNA